MAQENVDFVLGMYAGAEDLDYVPLYRDDGLWAEFSERLRPFFQPGFPAVWHEFGEERCYEGIEGFRALMLAWMAPWVTYGVEQERAIDLGDRVLVLSQDRGRQKG